jgi:RimJ/RimL family protein N-acetyltransferase
MRCPIGSLVTNGCKVSSAMAVDHATADLRTPRLSLRRWLVSDRVPFAAMNADPVVMEHFPATLSREQSDAMVERIEEVFDANGFGLWAVEVTATGEVHRLHWTNTGPIRGALHPSG